MPLHRLGPREYVEQLLSRNRKVASERRILTILFADVVGSTAIADTMDPEDVAAIMNGAFSILTEPITRHEGTLARLMGDAILCFFGAPVAHEDDPRRACFAALDILSGAERYADKMREEYNYEGFKVRVGVSTGLAVVGEVGTQDRAEYTAMGDAVNLASRLQSAAEPGTALINAETRSQAGELFETIDMGNLMIRGKAEPVHVFRLVGARTLRRETECDLDNIPMVNRESELNALSEAIAPREDGTGYAVLLSGDSGVGKSRLIAEARRITPGSRSWLEVKCTSASQFVSYAVVRRLLQILLEIDDSSPSKAAVGVLREAIISRWESGRADEGSYGDDSRTEFPESTFGSLAVLLEDPGVGDSSRPKSTSTPNVDEQSLQTGFGAFLRMWAGTSPLIIVWDDLHWIDQESLGVLQALSDVITTAPLILVLVARRGSDRVARIAHHFESASGTRFRSIPLCPLTHIDSRELLRRLMSNQPPSPVQEEHILRITEGNPFFLEQIAHTLLASHDAGETLTIPPTLQAAILARVDRLSGRDKMVLQSAALAGRRFPRAILTRVLADAMDPTQLSESLEALVRRGFLESVAQRRVSGENQSDLQFAQAMSHEVVSESVLRSERRVGHRKIAQAIETLYQDDLGLWAPVLMSHYEAAGDFLKVSEYGQLTGDRAVKLHALASALEHYTRALEFLSNAPSSAERTARQKCLWERIADLEFSRGNYEDATVAFEKAFAHCTSVHDCVELRRRIGLVQEKRGRYNEAVGTYESALQLLEGHPCDAIAARIYAGLCVANYHLNNLAIAAKLGERAVAMSKGGTDQRAYAEACNDLAIVRAASAQTDQARQLYDESRRIWTHLGDHYGLAMCFNNLGCLSKSEERWSDAIRELGVSLELFTVLGNRHAIARVHDNLAEVYYLTGQRADAEQHMALAVKLLSEIGMKGTEVLPEMWQSGIW